MMQCSSQQGQSEFCFYTIDKEETFLFPNVLGQLKGGESRDSRWVGEEGEGLCLQMLLVWMLVFHRNVLERL